MTGKLALVLAMTVAVGAGCGGGVESLSFPTPPSSLPTSATSTPIVAPANSSGVKQAAVPGHSTTTAEAITPGEATISGTVLGPNGAVGGATVDAERVVGSSVVATQAVTAGDGSFTIPNILGGIYRVRAWMAPSLALTTPQVFFLAGTQNEPLTLQLVSYAGVQITSSMAPQQVTVGSPANVVVQVTEQVVGSDGVVRPEPQVNLSVELTSMQWMTLSSDPAVTDSSGRAYFQVSCLSAGTVPLTAAITGSPTATLPTATCVAPTAPTTPSPTSSTTSTTTVAALPGT